MAKMKKNQEKRKRQIRDVRLRKLQKELKQIKSEKNHEEKRSFFFIVSKILLSSGYLFVKSIIPMEIAFMIVLLLCVLTIFVIKYNKIPSTIQQTVVKISSYAGDIGILFSLFSILGENFTFDFTYLIQYQEYITIGILIIVFILKYFFSKKENYF